MSEVSGFSIISPLSLHSVSASESLSHNTLCLLAACPFSYGMAFKNATWVCGRHPALFSVWEL